MWSLSFFFCKQKTAYEMRISDWSSDVCSSDLAEALAAVGVAALADRQVGVLLAQADLAVERGERGHPEGLALLGRRAGADAGALAGALAQQDRKSVV